MSFVASLPSLWRSCVCPDHRVIGKYRKSHRLPDEPIALGDDLPVFIT